MFCPKCGNQLPDGAKFCTSCGAQMAAAMPQQPQQPQQPQYQPPQQQYQQPVYQQQPYQQQYNQQQQYQQYHQSAYQQQPPYQQQYQQAPYGQQQYQQPYPMRQLKTNRALWKIIVFSLITFGIYPIVVFSGISEAINTAASRYDGKKTMHFCLLIFLIAPITFGIGAIVWFHRISNRIGNELMRRRLPYSFGASDFWIWYFLLSIIIVGPFIYVHKLCKAMNLICADYNVNG